MKYVDFRDAIHSELRRNAAGLAIIRQRQHASFEQERDLVRVDLVVLALPAVKRLHVEGVAEHEGDLFFETQVRQLVPGEHALGADHQTLSIRPHERKKVIGTGLDVLV